MTKAIKLYVSVTFTFLNRSVSEELHDKKTKIAYRSSNYNYKAFYFRLKYHVTNRFIFADKRIILKAIKRLCFKNIFQIACMIAVRLSLI